MGEDSEAKEKRRQEKILGRVQDKVKRNRMGCCSSFFSVIKAYTTLNIFLLPIGFKSGGYLFSPIILVVAWFFELTCAIKVTEAAHVAKIYSYPDLVEYALGPTYNHVFQVFQALLNLTFTIGPAAFFIKSLWVFIKQTSGVEVEMYIFLLIGLAIFAPLTWIRALEKFSWGFIFAIIVIFVNVVIASTLVFLQLRD